VRNSNRVSNGRDAKTRSRRSTGRFFQTSASRHRASVSDPFESPYFLLGQITSSSSSSFSSAATTSYPLVVCNVLALMIVNSRRKKIAGRRTVAETLLLP
jgi:hypothetical protein